MARLGWLVFVMVTVFSSGTASALMVPEGVPIASPVMPVSVAVPEIAASHLERRPAAPHILKVSLSRRSAAAERPGSVDPVQLLWLAALLTSACAFALYLGRELTIRLPAEERELARRG